MLKSIRLALFVILFAISQAAYAAETACPSALVEPTPEMIQSAMSRARDRGFLWSISKDGHTSYLYGTIHVAKFDWMFPGPKVKHALDTTDTVALEMDMLDADIQSRIEVEMQGIKSTSLPEALHKRLQFQAVAACVPYANIASMSPEMQVTALTMMVSRKAGLDASYGIDTVLAQIGHKAKKSVVSMETPEMQLQLLHMSNIEETISFVEDSLAELESGRSLKMLNNIAQLWSDADYAKMEKFEEWCECLNTENEREVMKRALDDRNPVLAEHIDGLHKDGKKVFAAVGSLHMFGPLGLPVLLEKKGYKVERVDFK